MEAAYGKPTYAAAKAALDALKPGLKLMNQSACGAGPTHHSVTAG